MDDSTDFMEGRGKGEKSTVMASCSYLEEKFQECSEREGVGLATSITTLGGGS